MSKTIRILTIIFKTQIAPYEVPAFRGAIAKRVGREHEWFHNHNNSLDETDTKSHFHNRYSLIQYKIKSVERSLCPMILLIDKSVHEVHELFKAANWQLRINERIKDFSDYDLKAYRFDVQINEKGCYYNIYRWQAFNSINFKEYQQIEGQRAKYEFLEQLLRLHIIAFLQGINWRPDPRVSVAILEIHNKKWISYKSVKVLCFDLHFKCNITLPAFIGLGRAASKGFGVLRTAANGKS